MFLKIFNDFFLLFVIGVVYFILRYYAKGKLIFIKKWLQSTDYKKMSKFPFPFIAAKVVGKHLYCPDDKPIS